MTLTHLFRRGFEAAHGAAHGMMAGDKKPDHPEIHVNPIAALVFFLTAIVCMFVVFSIGYTYGHIIPTLCMVEAPETEAYLPVDVIEPESESEPESGAPPAYTEDAAAAAAAPKNTVNNGLVEPEVAADPEVLLVRNKPYTSSIRETMLHLRARGGYMSRYRGLSMFLVWHILAGWIVAAIAGGRHGRLGVAVAAIIAETLLATLQMTWVHIVISEPSEKRWYKRIPSFRTWPKIAPAVALFSVSSQIVSILPMLVAGSFGSMKHMRCPDYEPSKKDLYAVAAQGILAMFLTLALFLLIQIPALVTMVRVAASMLPEEDETIVPFDRTFGGKTTPAILGGSGKIGLVEAWRSFPWESRVRLVRLMIKVSLIMIAAWFLLTTILVAEAHVLFGNQLREIMKAIHGKPGSN